MLLKRGLEMQVSVTLLMMTLTVTSCELIHNGDFENGMSGWHCWGGFSCSVISTGTHDSPHALRTNNRTQNWQGPSQTITTQTGKDYRASSWVRILNDLPDQSLGQTMELEVDFLFPDNTHNYVNVALRPLVTTSDGWFLMEGEFQAPLKPVQSTTFYYQGPSSGVDYAVDQASVTEVTSDPNWRQKTDDVIDRVRKSDINISVTTSGNMDLSAVKVQILQTRKSFPFGVAVDSWKYVDPAKQKYRDFIHTHFTWAVQGNALKWRQIDWNQHNYSRDAPLYSRALDTIKGLKAAGLKLRGHNMVWSVSSFIPASVLQQSGDQLRKTVSDHISWTLNATHGFLEHWDVNNENLHGQWFQQRLQDRDYDLELFRLMYAADPQPRLFLNDYNVVAQGAATSAYLAQAVRFKNASVHLGGIGVQYHFQAEQRPNPTLIKGRLDRLATVGEPIWVTELDTSSKDNNQRADFYEMALRAAYGHEAVEGIMFWSYYGDNSSSSTALVIGDSMQLTEAGRRVLDLLENEWMTDKTFTLTSSNQNLSLRGFHGDYEARVFYQGQEMRSLRQTFNLDKSTATISLNIHQ